jgi:hypothetical protein
MSGPQCLSVLGPCERLCVICEDAYEVYRMETERKISN